MSDIAIRVENLGKQYHIGALQKNGGRYTYKSLRDSIANAGSAPFRAARALMGRNGAVEKHQDEMIWALKDVSFDVKHGEIVGVIGRNGAGKSTLLKVLSRITEPTTGRVEIRGRVGSLLEVGTGFHPELTGRDNVYLNGAILGMKRAEIARNFDAIVAFAEVEKFIDTPVTHYSSGMYLRLAFAVAAHLQTEVLIVDEVLAVGDAEFQKKCLGKMREVSQGGRTVIFVSHNIQAISQLCVRALVLQAGQLVFSGDVSRGISRYAGIRSELSTGSYDLTDYPRSVRSSGVRLLQADFRDQGGALVSRAQRSSDLTVVVRFAVERGMIGLDLAMAVIHVEGQRVFSELYSDRFGTMSLSPGEFEIRFAIPLRFLKLDSYFLTLAILENLRPCDQVDGLSLPEIVDPDTDPHTESHRWGLVRLPVAWTGVIDLASDSCTTFATPEHGAKSLAEKA
jgi:lipopolysaccharide transport system ATP-binding protein